MDFVLLATTLNPNGSFVFTLTVVIAGLGIVLATLGLLILIFSAFGKLLTAAQSKAKKEPEAPGKTEKVKNEVPPPPPIIEDEGIAPEVIAAISAAVYMQENKNVTIKSIKRKRAFKQSGNSWAKAGIIENTKPF